MKRINALYYIREALKNVFINGFMGIASICILMSCLIIIGLFMLMSRNVELNLNNIEDQNEIVVFIDESLSLDDAKKLQPRINAIPNIKQSIFVSNDEALKSFESEFSESEELMAELLKDNPLRHSYRIILNNLEQSDQTAADLENILEIAKIRRNETVTNNIINMKNIFSILSLVFFVILFIISIFIIYNTIRLAMVARKKEINIMKFVGATNAFIRWPFIIEGLIIGFIAATLAYTLQWYIYSYFIDEVIKGINIIKLLEFGDVKNTLIATFYITGMFVGVSGSTLAIKKYLDV